MTRRYILSPVGTSILTNTAREMKADGQKILANSNAKDKSEVPASDLPLIEEVIEQAREQLKDADLERAAKMSAELNGIIKIYDGSMKHPEDFHQLLCTDTWLGEVAANLVKNWLEGKGLIVHVHRQKDLRTDDLQCFQAALTEIVKFCEEVFDRKRDQQDKQDKQVKQVKVIFNLTGGFKSVQGFLQTLALFYADETYYIFETSKELLQIPRLPVKMDAEGIVRNHLTTFRRLALGLRVEPEDTKQVEETFLFRVNDECTLSGWGELVWQKTQKDIYQTEIFAPPSPKIEFGKDFLRSIKKLNLSGKQIFQINRKIDYLARELEKGQKLDSLGFKELKGNPCPPSTHELDAWHDQDAKRIFGHFNEDGVFVLDKLDKALHR